MFTGVSREKLEATLTEMEATISFDYGMNLNGGKRNSGGEHIRPAVEKCCLFRGRLEVVESFTCVGRKIASDGRSKTEIIRRIFPPKIAF